ncbi:Mrp/NBP35 family ATP-binding protein [Anianabacter salinae]|uniref:Mrp/NBP35 family ATP-binding protein n=1 Tax=Anianabacter salinae TaxID=2851023 RepID=UPI00225E1B25|nr:Mrp/NBP35 family ATP-binding protein [Anianabacter salinae]MBV0912377.1 Mrp/NBP35 family ATP-binding protein [Anianabacter salinae]
MSLDRQAILDALETVKIPGSDESLVSADVIRALTVEDGIVRFVIEVPPDIAPKMEPVRLAAIEAVEALAGAGKVSALLTAHSEKRPPDLKIGRHPTAQPQGPQKVPGVGAVVAVASGKGGVGKSTVAANLACALALDGLRVGLLDADLYGPSQPRMMGVSKRPASPDGKTIIPLTAHGVTMMSLGLMVAEDEPVIWRGPMLMGALQQMLGQVQWGELDILVIDLPPGTGDVQMTLAQKTVVAGAVIVSTPQDISLLDVRKAVNMFAKLKVPMIGMVENMSAYICPECGHEAHIFGHGGAKADAERMGLPFLGEVPLDLKVREAGDSGAPVVVAHPESREAEAFRAIARRVSDVVV